MGIFTVTREMAGQRARLGRLSLPHGDLNTPVFMPVGTNASVKALRPEDIQGLGYSLILSNTYHLALRPGVEVIKSFGGLHQFCGWPGNILTDSGGYQVFSLSAMRKLSPKGVRFRSHVDGRVMDFTPEGVVGLQSDFNSDIMMQLDVCTPHGVTKKVALEALELSTAWAKSSKKAWLERPEGRGGSLFPIVQGNFYSDLRRQSAEALKELDLPGIAIGGLSVGEPYEVFSDFLEETMGYLDSDKPVYVMGIGSPDFVLRAIECGVDMFDCVQPTREARNGKLLTRDGPISIKKAKYQFDHLPVDPQCGCPVCSSYSRAYLRHLFKCSEILYSVLASQHNLAFMADLLEQSRQSIGDGTFVAFKKDFLNRYFAQGDLDEGSKD